MKYCKKIMIYVIALALIATGGIFVPEPMTAQALETGAPAGSPAPEATAVPTESPAPEATAVPTESPAPEATAAPTESPVPEATMAPMENSGPMMMAPAPTAAPAVVSVEVGSQNGEYTTNHHGVMAYRYLSMNFDIYGYFADAWRQTTYKDYGYYTYVEVGSNTERITAKPYAEGGDTQLGLNVALDFVFANEGKTLQIVYRVKNTTGDAITFSMGSSADIQIGSDDNAVITPFDDGSGYKMVSDRDNDMGPEGDYAQFNFFGKSYAGVTSVDDFWYGRYSDWVLDRDIYTFCGVEQSQSGNFDSAGAWHWKDEILPAGEEKTYSVLIGIGGAGSENAASGGGVSSKDGSVEIELEQPVAGAESFTVYVDGLASENILVYGTDYTIEDATGVNPVIQFKESAGLTCQSVIQVRIEGVANLVNIENSIPHTPGYHKNGNTIEVSCSETGCAEPMGSVTLTVPTGPILADGTAKPGTLTNALDGQIVCPAIVYEYKNGGIYQLMTGVPTEVGEYRAGITMGDVTVALTYSIESPITEVAKPTGDARTFTYSGEDQTYVITGEGNDAYTISGNVQKNAGSYTVTVALKNTDKYVWADGSTAPLTFDFVIGKATPVLGDVTPSGVIMDTTAPGEVVLNRVNTTVPGSLKLANSVTAMKANVSVYDWTFIPTDGDNYYPVGGQVQIDVLDTVSPSVELHFADQNWKTLLNNITFGLFFRETQTATVTAYDNADGSGLREVLYYVADRELAETELSAVSWQVYITAFDVNPDGKYVVYVKALDNDGNSVIVNSQGVVLDATQAVLAGITDGGVYYGDITCTVTDALAGVKEVIVDGTPVTLTQNQALIAADNGLHTVKVTDNAGNVTEYSITVYKNYQVEFKVDGVTVDTQTVGYGQDAVLPVIPPKAGYDDVAPVWEMDGTNVTADLVIHAVYTQNTPGVTEHVTRPEGNAFCGDITSEDTEIIGAVLDDNDTPMIALGKDIDIYLEVTDIFATVSPEDKACVERALVNSAACLWMDISLYKQVEGEAAQKITSTSRELDVTITIPEEWMNHTAGIKRTYRMVRVHNGEATILDGVFDSGNATFTIKTDKFSTYVLIYDDNAGTQHGGSDTTGGTQVSGSTETASASTGAANVMSPKTGDESHRMLWVVLMVVSGGAMLYGTIWRKKED
ncbi:MAG: hypothetical protein IJB84_03265 [Lachnospiraceae bacterium]|nr:hypothetical protein [Lachnospiraceae bacterium]